MKAWSPRLNQDPFLSNRVRRMCSHNPSTLAPLAFRQGRSLGSVAAMIGLCVIAPAACPVGRPEVVIRPAPGQVVPLTVTEQRRVQEAIDRGVAYLRRTQLPTGSWIIGKEGVAEDYAPPYFAAGFAGLGGLALLDCGVPAGDRAVQAAARYIRLSGPRLFRTYDLTLALLFLDRLGDARDQPLIRSLALRLAAGQTTLGGWGYNCPILNTSQEKKFTETLRKKTRADVPARFQPPPAQRRGQARESADNSNTQFAVLALAAARRHDLPLDYPMGLLEQRFRLSENGGGWDYRWDPGIPKGYGSMTCVGLLALAVGRAAADPKAVPQGPEGKARPEDPHIAWGLKVLGAHLRDPTDSRAVGPGLPAPRGALSLYFLWSVERVGVLCGVQTIGGTDWYRWGAGILLPAQRPDGSWLGRGSGGYPAADTCFALLFLKRSDLLPDLRKELAKRVRIVDAGPLVQGGPTKKGGPDPKGLPDLKGIAGGKGTMDQEAPLAIDLGEVKAGRPAALPLRVRGPAPFRIIGIRGGDAQLKVEPDSQSAAVHDLTVTLRLEKAGTFERTVYLETDLPGRAEVEVRVRVTAAGGAGRPD
jgi:hypothetical protein